MGRRCNYFAYLEWLGQCAFENHLNKDEEMDELLICSTKQIDSALCGGNVVMLSSLKRKAELMIK
jgi:hypothetical protein